VTPERWQAVKELLQAALERAPDERSAFLEEACRADAALKREVESLLAAREGATGFLEPPTSRAPMPAAIEADLVEPLQITLGAAYTIERELGGGGMSRVFVAEEVALGRRVVVKVLPPELAQEVDVERFRREIRLAASLQHPHVAPVHAAGEAGGLLYYTMPFVEGESLKERLAREGALPIPEAVHLLREVADALAYAHRQRVVHRDVKPANVLLEEGHALVTDFGIAKALAAATRDTPVPTITSTGLVLGTPAYMAPEQASGGATDHRSDLYALGCLAYEMLTGEPPFGGGSVQTLLAAHLVQAPEPITKHRPEVPPQLAGLVLRLLEKNPADRPQSAEAVLEELAVVAGRDEPAAAVAPTLRERLRRARLLPVFALYLASSFLMLGAARVLTLALGLPDWVVPGAVVLLLIGLPIILATALVQRGRSPARPDEGHLSQPSPTHRLTWRKAILGGVLAFALWGVVVAAYMALRALGIGPVGSLLAVGVLKNRERIILADFQNRTRDTLLGSVVTEAFRIDLAQSPAVTLVAPEQVAEVLARTRRPATARLDAALAREVAVREGIKAVVTGDVAAAGPQYVLSARLVSAANGEVLAAQRKTARDSTELLDAVDGLSRKLREKIGESLKTIRREQPLERVTTGSLEALRKYTQGVRAAVVEGDFEKLVALLEEAVALDSGFAMAYRSLGIARFYSGEAARAVQAISKAYEHRDRLPERERYHTTASYYWEVTVELDKAVATCRKLLETYPDDAEALNTLGHLYFVLRQYAAVDAVLRRAVALPSPAFNSYVNLMRAQVALGKRREAQLTLDQMGQRFPDNGWVQFNAVELAASGGDYEAAEDHARRIAAPHPESPFLRWTSSDELAKLAAVRGRLAEAERHGRDAQEAALEAGGPPAYVAQVVANSFYLIEASAPGNFDVRLRRAPAQVLKPVEAALARYPLDSLKPLDRRYVQILLAQLYALASKPERARELLTEHERVVEPALRRRAEQERHGAWAEVALAEGRLEEAVAEFRQQASRGWCTICGLTGLGRVYDLAGVPDSAVAAYERYVTTPFFQRLGEDTWQLADVYKRLGQLYEARGERAKAVHYYTRFVDLWRDCDPALRPQVAEARRRLARLGADSGT
jgi:eukaryotic-like serine/threonine-protein kinase